MTDFELTVACAHAMGYLHVGNDLRCATRASFKHKTGGRPFAYDPLHDDDQSMALVKRLRLHICPSAHDWSVWPQGDDPDSTYEAHDESLNRAIVTCVASIQSGRRGKP